MLAWTNTFKVPAVVLILLIAISAQVGPKRQPGPPAKKTPRPQPSKPEAQPDADPQDRDVLKLGTTLVTVPVIVSDRNGIYIPDMRKDEFTLFEDEVKQEVIFFATIKEPFHVVLMLDTSASTQEKLGQIQRAAIAFVEQLQSADRVKVISFDDDIRDLNDFTSDRTVLREAIQKSRPGKGTRLYDAFHLGLQNLKYEQGRKAIVLFTDGVDWHSNSIRYEDNIGELEESGVIVYPIRYDTRVETEALVRQQERAGRAGDLGVIFGDPRRTPPTVPGGDPPPEGRTENRDPYGLPIPPVVIPQPRRNPNPGGGRYPDDRYPDPRNPGGGRFPDPRIPDSRRNPIPGSKRAPDDSISVMLDHVYEVADRYLNDLASTSGGKLHRADTLVSLPDVFARIGAEIRTQYALGYYPSNKSADGTYRKIHVRTSRKDVVIRARPGYRAAANTRPQQR